MAAGEESRAGYNGLRTHVHAAGDILRQRQAALANQPNSPAPSLSSPSAYFLFPEYGLPYLVFYMAHHTLYASEQKSDFVSFQRALHIFYDELLRHGNQSLSFVQEMLRKLKQHDDAVSPHADRTRVLCDLAAKVLFEVLSSRAVASDQVRPFPGSVVLPRCYMKPLDPHRYPAEQVYLDKNVIVASHVPFRALGASTSVAPEDGPDDAAHGGEVPVDIDEVWDVGAADVLSSSAAPGATASNNSSAAPSATKKPRGGGGRRAAASSQQQNSDEEEFVASPNGRSSAAAAPPAVGQKRSRSQSKNDVANSSAAPMTEADKERAEIRAAVAEFSASRTLEELRKCTWSVTKTELERILGHRLRPELRQITVEEIGKVLAGLPA